MSLKDAFMLGAVGAAGIFVARKIPVVGNRMDQGAPTTNGALPLVPDVMVKNGWSAAFVLIPAAAAWYLSK
jgi:hypothetical protein